MAGGFSTGQGASEPGKKRGGRRVLVEPPAMLLVDIAFNLLLFFVACASTEPQGGRKQVIPRGESKAQAEQSATENIEVALTRTTVSLNGSPTLMADFRDKVQALLAGKKRPEERIVLVKSAKDTPYHHWVLITGLVEQAGGVVTLQLEEDREVDVR
jgi:biopolymer transport protein ExbD